MSQPQKQPPVSYRGTLEPIPGSGKEHFADALSTIEPKHLHVRTRIPAIFAMATHSLVAKALRKERNFTNLQGVTYDMHTLAGRMECWQFEYEAIAPSLDGKAREEVVKVMQLAAIGGQDETGQIASNVLNEGNKVMTGKASKTS